MLIEIHMIQNHSPSNLNRDDLGAPKTCLFGGVTRARISSQCLKRSIRRSAEFQKVLEQDGGVRTRRLITILAEQAHGSSPAPNDLIDLVAKAFEKGGVKRESTKDDPNTTNILMFVPQSAINAMADLAKNEAAKKKPDPGALAEALMPHFGKAAVPDMALCGRMTELDSKGLFRKIEFHVEAALSVAHAISTHAVVNEVDYFTAVDDRANGKGAGHIDEAMYASACFYKYFCLDWDQLVRNLTPRDGDGNAKEQAGVLAAKTLEYFLRAATLTTPTGKQNSFAAFNPPDGILVEIKRDGAMPLNYANAFADPVLLGSQRGLIGESIVRLGQYVHEIAGGYGIQADRRWFSPSLRYPLTYIDREAKESEKEKPVIRDSNSNLSSLDDLVKQVRETISRKAELASVGA